MKESRNVNQANGNALINAADISRHYTMADGTVQALDMFSGLDTKTLADNELSRIRNERIGFIFQSFNLIPTLSVVENVALPLTYRGIPTAKRLERSLSALEAVGLSARLSHKPYELSGGQQQRVAIARAIAADPDLILADEPCGNLDSRSGKEVMELLLSRHKCGKTVIAKCLQIRSR